MVMQAKRMKYPRILSEEEVAHIFKAAESNARDCMILKCLYYLGLKSKELLALKTSDIDVDKAVINITEATSQRNRKEKRGILIPGRFSIELQSFILGKEGPVFAGRSNDRALSDRHIRRIVKEYARLADVRNYEEIKPHTFRVSYAAHLRKDGIPVKSIQKLLGHSRRETTYIYTHGLNNTKTSVTDF